MWAMLCDAAQPEAGMALKQWHMLQIYSMQDVQRTVRI